MNSSPFRVLAISGSLRAKSVNTAALSALQSLAPAGVSVTLYDGLGTLPHFNPDLDVAPLPAPVAALHTAVAAADALVICSPEYAHGIPGVLKNALDWLVSFEGFINKPVAVINARPGATHADASLRETLSVMNTRLLGPASITLPLTSNTPDAAALLKNDAVREQLQAALTTLQAGL
jgi:NAD(P)H-dependent FMN reductase